MVEVEVAGREVADQQRNVVIRKRGASSEIQKMRLEGLPCQGAYSRRATKLPCPYNITRLRIPTAAGQTSILK